MHKQLQVLLISHGICGQISVATFVQPVHSRFPHQRPGVAFDISDGAVYLRTQSPLLHVQDLTVVKRHGPQRFRR